MFDGNVQFYDNLLKRKNRRSSKALSREKATTEFLNELFITATDYFKEDHNFWKYLKQFNFHSLLNTFKSNYPHNISVEESTFQI